MLSIKQETTRLDARSESFSLVPVERLNAAEVGEPACWVILNSCALSHSSTSRQLCLHSLSTLLKEDRTGKLIAFIRC